MTTSKTKLAHLGSRVEVIKLCFVSLASSRATITRGDADGCK